MRPEENCEGTSEPELDLRPDKYRILAQFRATVYTFPLSSTNLALNKTKYIAVTHIPYYNLHYVRKSFCSHVLWDITQRTLLY